ncbi:lipopolysaccharide N-acetylglucosaminyltransferase [Acetobacter estunensis NRIC 0472]|uniref:Glycosyltransferase n=1 Tax=Acetobacter estunensis TaxID=104097 RepID=A0A967B5U7_9PROT|nr:glycosyltransferase family 1 protein [Acetobacter estunensis]NHO54365.1 glycosyltransferase [Acetobacter estunensis]GBQ21828.1 lipopolysaccharide N-acetylglucosaminyltransferase [Acetobacter estunensis NRIC 0472]
MSRKLWIDATDLRDYLDRHSRPSGIQRVVFELGTALATLAPEQVRFVHRTGGPRQYETFDWNRLRARFATLTNTTPRGPIRTPETDGISSFTPPEGRLALLGASLRTQARVLQDIGRVGHRATERGLQALRQRMSRSVTPDRTRSPGQALDTLLRPGDAFFVPGSPWELDDYADTVRWLRDDRRVAFGLLIHDLVPLLYPQWCDRGVIRTFTQWHATVLPLADRIFTTSRAVADDVTAHAARIGIPLPHPVTRIGMGVSNFPTPLTPRPERLPPAGSYVLFVSTLEARKNHALLLRVWRKLLDKRGPDAVPTLVFAGRRGWRVNDLMQQLENANWLDGHIVHVADPGDGELAALYDGCLFTLFPSLAEGWGLPVTESLTFGQPCLASSTTAMPEAGGMFTRHFDPEDAHDALRQIEALLDAPKGLAQWRRRIRAEFTPPSWRDCAARVLSGFGLSP